MAYTIAGDDLIFRHFSLHFWWLRSFCFDRTHHTLLFGARAWLVLSHPLHHCSVYNNGLYGLLGPQGRPLPVVVQDHSQNAPSLPPAHRLVCNCHASPRVHRLPDHPSNASIYCPVILRYFLFLITGILCLFILSLSVVTSNCILKYFWHCFVLGSFIGVLLYQYYYGMIDHSGVMLESIWPWQPPSIFHDNHHK